MEQTETNPKVPLMSRLRPELHAELIDVAQHHDVSLNRVLNDALDYYLRHTWRNRRSEPTGADSGASDEGEAWVVADGMGWATYVVAVHFSLPAFSDADRRMWDIKDALRDEATHWGGRDVWTDEHAVRAMYPDDRQCSGIRPAFPIRYSTDGQSLRDYAPTPAEQMA